MGADRQMDREIPIYPLKILGLSGYNLGTDKIALLIDKH